MRVKPIRLLLIIVLALLPGACAHDTQWLYRAEYDILATNTDDDWFLIDGNHAAEFRVDGLVEVHWVNDEDAEEVLGPYTITAVAGTMNGTRISIDESVPDEDLAGAVLMQVSDEDSEPDPEQILISFETTGNFTSDIWYYIVFNFSQANGTSVSTEAQPIAEISDEDRCKNWEMYVLIHQDDTGGTELSSLRTTRLPTVLAANEGPLDATTGFFNDDDLIDVAVACNLDNTLELFPAYDPDIYDIEDIKYWDDDEVIAGGGGPGPYRIHGGDQNGDGVDDLVVLYEGNGADNGFLRILAGDDVDIDGKHDGSFTQFGSDLDLGVTPVDWLIYDVLEDEDLDFNSDGYPDLAVLGTVGGTGQLLVLNGLEGGGFELGNTYGTAAEPVSLAGGVLLDNTFDLAVGSNSGTGGTGEVQVFTADGSGGFTASTVLSVDGILANVAVAKMFGAVLDVVATFNTETQGGVAIFLNEADAFFTEEAEVITYNGSAYCLLPLDTSDDNYRDIVITDGVPDEDNHTMYIIQRDGTKPTQFVFEDEIINYLVDAGPGRIHLTDLDGDGYRDDFVIPSYSPDSTTNSINLVYGQGESNFTDASRYWTDYQPESLTLQPWYAGHNLGPNSFTLAIDPLNFYNLTQLEVDDFVVSIMTGTTAPDFNRNVIGGVEQDGEILESMDPPIGVNVNVDYLQDESNTNRVLEVPSDPAADLYFWRIEVI